MWIYLSAICLASIVVLAGLIAYACAAPASQWLCPALVRGPEEGRQIALTFDDGPSAPFTEQVLDILRRYDVPATFFACGKNVERFPEVVQRIQREGHVLGNHTYSHPLLLFRTPKRMAEEIDRAQDAIEKITGERPSLFRPPYGVRGFRISSILRKRGLRMVQWSGTGYDWKYAKDAVIRATVRRLAPGVIILLHDGHEARPPSEVDRSNTVEALPAILDAAMKEGFKFVSVQAFSDQIYGTDRVG